MFERFTDDARRVIVLAQEESRLLNHNYIGTEHILLGLLHEGGDPPRPTRAGKALASLHISLDAVREQVRQVDRRGCIRVRRARPLHTARQEGPRSLAPRDVEA